MDNLNGSVNKDEQVKKIIEDTEEIIKNFREISAILAEKADTQEYTMNKLGSRIIHDRQKFLNPSENLGTEKINFI